MNFDHVIKQIDKNRWKMAQDFELQFAKNTMESDDDWNIWWAEKFDNYEILNGKFFSNVLEVGCGPHTNIRYILPKITFEKIWLEDPLIQYYLYYNFEKFNSLINFIKFKMHLLNINYLLKIFSNLSYPVDLSSSKLEELPYKDRQMDLIICINVLDHVNDYDKCMEEIFRVLNNKGILILGQDLSNEEDKNKCPESYADIGHPIKLDQITIENSLEGKYQYIFKKILPREEGRNPKAHYGTFLGIMSRL